MTSMCQHNTDRSLIAAGDPSQSWTVNDILRQFGPAYLNKYQDRMSLDQVRTLKALMRCRDPTAGSIPYYCHQCTRVHHVPKACGNAAIANRSGENWIAIAS